MSVCIKLSHLFTIIFVVNLHHLEFYLQDVLIISRLNGCCSEVHFWTASYIPGETFLDLPAM